MSPVGDLIVLVGGLIAIAAASALWWWFRDRDHAAQARDANQLAAAWSRRAAEHRNRIAALEWENERLAAEVERLTPGEVVARLHQRMGDQS